MSAPGGGAETLYQRAIVEAARTATGAGRLPCPHASVSVDNPLCGDRVSIDLAVDGARVSGIAHRVKGCLLCEASASVVAANALGARAQDLDAVRAALEGALANGFDDVALAWPALEMFAPVAAHRSRHRCVILPFEALCAALADCRDPGGDT